MLYRSISVAIIVLLSWLTYMSVQSSQNLSRQIQGVAGLYQQSSEQVDGIVETQVVITDQIKAIEAFIAKQDQSAKEKQQIQAKLSKEQQLTELYKTYAAVLRADALRGAKKFPEAAALLKGTKKAIWKAGDTYKEHQKSMRGLMQKVDALVNAWNAKDGSKTAFDIHETINKVLQDKGK